MVSLFFFVSLLSLCSSLPPLVLLVDGTPSASLSLPSLSLSPLLPLPPSGLFQLPGLSCRRLRPSQRVLVLSGSPSRLLGCHWREEGEEGPVRAEWQLAEARVPGATGDEERTRQEKRKKKEEAPRAAEAAEPSFFVRYWWVFAGLPLLVLMVR